ncbi:methyltransferase domain-containing protein [candidate division KSB1 bacterium]|nr:methyltransferase domain-containing protein [candidate division KSB1 bacterium]NIV70739.1 methyltransferase domain-containing protein [Phycisphaerae bacterium]NIR73400.1 methyltransferase domain-containing protein [candidate division KSB1 bacterium]NIS23941.1 methyltransferase domain-containing protein [candidate division KSB1 bacterium]NIT70858.1 methyltransferase domain-containing protein [candidate division KSB1 bacterium]
MTSAYTCPTCNSLNIEVFFALTDVPVFCNVLWRSKEEAMGCERGDIKLAFCHDCSMINNAAFDPTLVQYSREYENSLHFSPRFQDYATNLAKKLIDRFDLRGKHIVEIGCGKGDFLSMLCEMGGNHGIGFDPSYEQERTQSETAKRITFIQDYYSEQYADCDCDFLCCRHMLEHLENPRAFLEAVRRTLGSRRETIVFFEVPNALFTLRDMAIWDIIYEHCLYFTPESLAALFSTCGFDVLNVDKAYEGQFLVLEAVARKNIQEPRPVENKKLQQISGDVREFRANYERKKQTWLKRLRRIQTTGQKAVIWGSGSKGVTFLNALKIRNKIEYAVDINPHKQGKFVAGTGQKIVPPSFLQLYQPDVIVVMNPIYKKEISQQVKSLGVAAELLVDDASI